MKENSYYAVYECKEFRKPSLPLICKIEADPQNVAAFIVSASSQKNYALCNNMDECEIITMGKFADLIPNPVLREEILKYLIPMQLGKLKPPNVRYVKPPKRKQIDRQR